MTAPDAYSASESMFRCKLLAGARGMHSLGPGKAGTLKSRNRASVSAAPANSKALQTFGQLLPEGHMLELVADPADASKLNLLYWNGQSAKIAPTFEVDGRIYHAAELPPGLMQVMRLPTKSTKHAPIGELFTRIVTVFEENLDLSRDNAERLTFFSVATWFPEFLPSAPCLSISGPNVLQGISVLRLLSCVCRRALMLAEVTAAGLHSLPDMHATLLILDQELPRKMKALLCASSHRGLYVPGRGGLCDLYGPRAIFSLVNSTGFMHGEAIQVTLIPSRVQPAILDDSRLGQIAGTLQPSLLAYRLKTFPKVAQSRFDVPQFSFPTRGLAAALGACVPDDERLAARLILLLEPQDNDVRAERCSDPHFVLLEVLLGLVHEALSTAGGRKRVEDPTVKEIAGLFNTLLRSRGGIREYSPEELGWMLNNPHFSRIRSAAGMRVSLSAETSRRVHQLARAYDVVSLQTARPDCRECAEKPKTAV